MRVSPVIGRAASGKSYDQFRAHIATLATDGEIGWANGWTIGNHKFRTTVGVVGGSMAGSSWGDVFALADLARIFQHALPDYPTLLALLGSEAYFELVYAGQAPTYSTNRNNFRSASEEDWYVFRVDDLIYFHPTLGPQRMRPYQQVGPQLYDWIA